MQLQFITLYQNTNTKCNKLKIPNIFYNPKSYFLLIFGSSFLILHSNRNNKQIINIILKANEYNRFLFIKK